MKVFQTCNKMIISTTVLIKIIDIGSKHTLWLSPLKLCASLDHVPYQRIEEHFLFSGKESINTETRIGKTYSDTITPATDILRNYIRSSQ